MTLLKGATCLYHVFAKLWRPVFGIGKTFRSIVGKRGPSTVMFLILASIAIASKNQVFISEIQSGFDLNAPM